MTESRIPTQGFLPADHELWEQIDGAGALSETIMRFVGGFGIGSETVTREIIFAIAQLERRLPPPPDEDDSFGDGSNPKFPHSRDW